jgi:LmbE family N-acetylglucosaminyl deacetylase
MRQIALADEGLTAVYVHAHPDDEALFTGGRLALCALHGERQVLITCTDGSLGFDPSGRTPLEEGHDKAATALARSDELRRSADVLGIDCLVELGIPDSGMAGWPTTHLPEAFVNRPLEDIAAQLAELFDEEGPCVVVTYAADGFYGHPDHVQTHRAVMRACEQSPSVLRAEAVVMTTPAIEAAIAAAARSGQELPEWLGRRLVVAHPELEVTREVDATMVADVKQRAVGAHATQIDNLALSMMAPAVFAEVFGIERYVTIFDPDPGRVGSPSA